MKKVTKKTYDKTVQACFTSLRLFGLFLLLTSAVLVGKRAHKAYLYDYKGSSVVMLKGYTDKSGNPTTNFRLSKQRAEAVKAYLVRQGIQGDRIDISYYGDNAASVANDPFSRRVEVGLIIGQ